MYATAALASTLLLAGLRVARATDPNYFPPSLGYFFLEVPIPDVNEPVFVSEELLNANGGRLFYGRGTAASNASGDACPTNRFTTFLVSAPTLEDGNSTGVTNVFLNTVGFTTGARQQLYCSTASGEVLYTPAGELLPIGDSANPNFTYTPQTLNTGFGSFATDGGFSLCPDNDGGQQLFCSAYIPDGKSCNATSVATRYWYGGISAGVYN